MGRTWERSLPKEQYLYDYSTENRRRIALVTNEFPHTVKGTGAEVGGAFTDAWESSPYSDQYLNALAICLDRRLKLGRGPATDFLGISFSALDKVGHDFGPESHESQDVLIHLDAQLGLLFDKLDKDVGKGNYVVGLSSDHGVAPVPERVQAQGFDAGPHRHGFALAAPSTQCWCASSAAGRIAPASSTTTFTSTKAST